MRPEGVAGLALDLVGARDEAVEPAELPHPLRGGLLPHPRDAGQVVARVAAQRRVVGVLRRGQAVALLDGGRGHACHVADALARVEHRDAVVDQLERVAVAGDDEDVESLGLRPRGQRGDDVIGLVPLGLHRGDAQRLEHLADQVDLALELRRARAAVGLVVGEGLRAEGLPRHVEGHRDVAGAFVPQGVDEHGGEAVDRVRGLARRGGEVLHGERVEGPVGQGVPVEQHEAGALPRGGGASGVGHARDPRLRG